jgi:hypothetical protein
MEVKKFMEENNYLTYEDLEKLLYKKYKLKTRLDVNNNYYMISTTNESEFTNKFVRQCTGIILEKGTNKILHYFGEKTYDIVNEYNNNIINLKDVNLEKCYITEYINGYIIKIFYYNNKWKFATSKHTDIKYYKINGKVLYNIFENYILRSFNTIYDFLNLLHEECCYTFVLENDNKNVNIINKFDLNILEEQFNFNNYKSLHKFINDKNEKNKKFIILEKNNNKQIIKKILISIDDIKKVICRYNNRCFNNSCKFIHVIKPVFNKNYKDYIILEKEKNILFKSKNCQKGNNCKYHMKRQCIYKHDDDPLLLI